MEKVKKTKNFVAEILKRILPKIGATIILEPEFERAGQITFSNGKRIFYVDTRFSINPHGSVEISRDKNYSTYYLKLFGYNVTEGITIFSDNLNKKLEIKRDIHDGFEYACKMGFPIIVKPNDLSEGLFVTKVYDKEEYFEAAGKILKNVDVMIVEKYYDFNDYRIVVYKNKVISAYQRESLKVVGNGKNSIIQLLETKQSKFIAEGRDTIIHFNDYRILQILKRNKMTFDTILDENRVLFLLDNANLSSGGMLIDKTKSIHNDYSSICINITKDMSLKLCGIDLMTNDLTKPLSDHVIIEINSAPGLKRFAELGDEEFNIVDQLYMDIVTSLEAY